MYRAPCHQCLLTSYAMLLPQDNSYPKWQKSKSIRWSRNTETRAAVMSYKITGLTYTSLFLYNPYLDNSWSTVFANIPPNKELSSETKQHNNVEVGSPSQKFTGRCLNPKTFLKVGINSHLEKLESEDQKYDSSSNSYYQPK